MAGVEPIRWVGSACVGFEIEDARIDTLTVGRPCSILSSARQEGVRRANPACGVEFGRELAFDGYFCATFGSKRGFAVS